MLTIREATLIFKAYADTEQARQQEQWNRVRWQTANLVNIQIKPASRKPADQMFPFPWDKTPETENHSTEDRFEYLKQKWSKKDGK